MIDATNVVSVVLESGVLVALKIVVVVDYCIGKATDDSLNNIYYRKWSEHRTERTGDSVHLCSLAS
jgi:hypothetical protein